MATIIHLRAPSRIPVTELLIDKGFKWGSSFNPSVTMPYLEVNSAAKLVTPMYAVGGNTYYEFDRKHIHELMLVPLEAVEEFLRHACN